VVPSDCRGAGVGMGSPTKPVRFAHRGGYEVLAIIVDRAPEGIRTPETLQDSIGRIRPEFGATVLAWRAERS
jgi:hypothetical protein